jgi:putative transcriptional regulator
MIKLKLDEMLEKRGMSAYALHKQSGLHQSVISKIKNNKSKALQLDVLDTLCAALNCQPADLIVYESEITTQTASATQNESNTQNTSTTQIVERATQNANTTQNASDNAEWLSTNAVAERLKISRKSVNDYILDGKLPATKGKDIPNHKGNGTHNFIKLDDVLIYESVYGAKD